LIRDIDFDDEFDIDDETALFLSDSGINIDGLSEDFQDINCVEATPFMHDIAEDVQMLKKQLSEADKKLSEVKKLMIDEIGIGRVDDEQFENLISQHDLPSELVQR
jgi:hypothetical protein